ncbi:MAG: isochorismate synthase MenF [Candidatus Planktophila sp.]
MTSLIPVTTAKVASHLPLLDLLPESGGLSWVRGGQGIVGWGQYAKTTVRGPHRFRDARQWWQDQLATFNVVNTLNISGTGPILFTSFSFDENEESILVIPEIVVGTRAGISWMTWIGDKAQPYLPKKAPDLTQAEFFWADGSLTPNEWMSRVATAIGEIEIGELEKVVLARDLIAVADKEIDIRPILNNLSEQYPSTWVFSVDNLIGATPELLLRLTRGMVTSRVLAGTISKTGDDEKDLALAASLARSSKDLEEHEYAVRSVADALEPFCTSTNVPESPFVLHLANVMHLATDVTGALIESKVDVDAFSLLSRLHPSAAVCGTPTHLAFKLITSIEGMNRGRYAGPVGWIDAHGDGELGIALRCGIIDGTSIRIFAGCGVVSGSDPAKELNESNAKFTPMRSALK